MLFKIIQINTKYLEEKNNIFSVFYSCDFRALENILILINMLTLNNTSTSKCLICNCLILVYKL